MGLEMKKIKTNRLHRLGHLTPKKDLKKSRIINTFDNRNINHSMPSTSDQVNRTIKIEIEHLKGNGIMYLNMIKFG